MITHKFQCKAIKAPASDKYLPVLIRKANKDLTTYYLLIDVSTDKNTIIPILLPIDILITSAKGKSFTRRSIYIMTKFIDTTPNLMDVLKEHFGELCTKTTRLITISNCSRLQKVYYPELEITIEEENKKTKTYCMTNESGKILASFIANWEQEILKRIPQIETNTKSKQQSQDNFYMQLMENNYQTELEPTYGNTMQQMIASDTTQALKLTQEEVEMMSTKKEYTKEIAPQTILSGSSLATLESFIVNWEQEILKRIPQIETNTKSKQQSQDNFYMQLMENNYQKELKHTYSNTMQQMIASDTTQTIRSTEEEPEMMLTEEEYTEEEYTEEATPQTILSGSSLTTLEPCMTNREQEILKRIPQIETTTKY